MITAIELVFISKESLILTMNFAMLAIVVIPLKLALFSRIVHRKHKSFVEFILIWISIQALVNDQYTEIKTADPLPPLTLREQN